MDQETQNYIKPEKASSKKGIVKKLIFGFLLLFGIFAIFIAGLFQYERSKLITEQDILAKPETQLQYPNSEIILEDAYVPEMHFLRSMRILLVSGEYFKNFLTSDDPETVMRWYEEQLAPLGWTKRQDGEVDLAYIKTGDDRGDLFIVRPRDRGQEGEFTIIYFLYTKKCPGEPTCWLNIFVKKI